MNCEEERKFFKLRMEAENKFRSASLLQATEPLGVKTPSGHSFTKKRREEIHSAEGELNTAKEVYQNHIKNCPTCNN